MSWLKRSKPPTVIYTDGSCLKPNGPGGWAAILITGQKKLEISGNEKCTTNNRMELTAAIMALESVPEGTEVFLYTDSKYLRDGITVWINGWLASNWMTREKKDVINRDLWERLHTVNQKLRVGWTWVKGHSTDLHNIRCDELASIAAREQLRLYKPILNKDEMLESEQKVIE